jgi:GTPase SAR1 family protein
MDLLGYFDVVNKKPKVTKYATIAERHTPTHTNDFLGNYKQIKDLDEWFLHGTKNLLLLGPTGCGKTSLIHLLCKKHHKTMYIQNSFQKRTKTELFKYYESVKYFSKHGMFVFDEMESFVNKSENISICEISKWQVDETKPVIRIIFVANSTYRNKLAAIAAISQTICLEYPTTKQLFSKCLDIIDQEKIDATDDEILRLKHIIPSLKEPRMVLNSLSMIACTDGRKDEHLDMYDIYRLLLDFDEPLDKKMRHFQCESGTIPIIMQENYINAHLDITMDDMCDISDSMSYADMYHKQIFVNNDSTQMSMYACLSSIFNPLMNINDVKTHSVYKSPTFGQIWTKVSASYQKRKYWLRFDESVSNPQLNLNHNASISYMNDMYKHMLSFGEPQDVMEFAEFYNIDTKHRREFAFDLYNSFNLNQSGVDAKTMTKKAFMTHVNRLSSV